MDSTATPHGPETMAVMDLVASSAVTRRSQSPASSTRDTQSATNMVQNDNTEVTQTTNNLSTFYDSDEDQPNESSAKRHRQLNWTIVEDNALAMSVLKVAQDISIAKSKLFWERVFEHFKAKFPDTARDNERLRRRWKVMLYPNLREFSGYYAQAEQNSNVGINHEEICQKALESWRDKYKSKHFLNLETWVPLWRMPKWHEILKGDPEYKYFDKSWKPAEANLGSRSPISKRAKRHHEDDVATSVATDDAARNATTDAGPTSSNISKWVTQATEFSLAYIHCLQEANRINEARFEFDVMSQNITGMDREQQMFMLRLREDIRRRRPYAVEDAQRVDEFRRHI